MRIDILFTLFLLVSTSCFSQSPEEMRKMHEFMQKRMEQIQKSLFSDDDFFSDDFSDVLQDMESNLDKSMRINSGVSTSISYSWKNEDSKRTLIIKKPDEKTPVDIVIENGIIKLSSKITKKTQTGTFVSQVTSSLSVPMELDPNKVDIKDKGETVEVIFPLKERYQGAKPVRRIIQQKAPSPKRKQPIKRPLKPRAGDITL